MKTIQILITKDPDDWVMEDLEDAIRSALSNQFNKWEFDVQVFDGDW